MTLDDCKSREMPASSSQRRQAAYSVVTMAPSRLTYLLYPNFSARQSPQADFCYRARAAARSCRA